MSETLGTIRGQMILDVRQTLNAYTSARQAHVSTVTALNMGAGALATTGAALAGVGIGMAAGILTAVDAAAQFERKLDYFSAVSNSTQAEYDAIREKALQLGADTIYSADQIAESFVELGKAGVGARDIIDGIGEGVASLGAAADIPLDTAAKIIMAAVQTFQLGADQAVHVADQLAGAANASIIDVEDLGVSLKYAGGVAASLGVPFEDLNTALALLGQYGIKGSTAGTSLRQVLLSLNGTTAKAKSALKGLGIITEDGGNKFYTAEGKAKSLSEVFQVLQDATQGMSDKQRIATMQQIFAVRALPSLIALTNSGAKGFETMAASIGKTTALEVASTRLDNLSGDLEILRGNIDTLMIESGSTVQEFARSFVQGITSIIQVFLDLPAGVQQGILIFLAVSAVLLIVIGSVGMLAGAILHIISLAIILAPVWTAITGAISTVTKAFWAFNIALLSNPIVLIVMAVLALIAVLVWFFTQTELGREVWANFTQFLIEAWNNIVSVATDVFTNLGSFFTDVWNNIVKNVTAAIDFILDLFFSFTPLGILIANWGAIMGFFQTLWANVTTGISNFITGTLAFFAALPQNILNFFLALPGMIGYAIGFVLGVIVKTFIMIGVWLAVNVPIIINNVVTFFQELPTKVGAFFADLYLQVITWLMTMAVEAAIWAVNLYNGLINWFQQLPANVAAFFIEMYANVVSWLTSLVTNGIALAISLYTGLINWFQQLPANVAAFFAQMVANVIKFMTEAVGNAIRLAANIYNGIRDAIAGLPGLVAGILDNVISAIKGAIRGAIKAVTAFASGLWEGFKDGLGIHSPSYIEHAMWAITDVIEDETQRMKKQVRVVQGLGNGITEMGQNMGFNFGTQLDQDLITLQDQLAAAKNMQSQVAAGETGPLGVGSSQTAALGALVDLLSEADLNGGDTYDIVVNNPEPEPASDSIPRTIRKIAYVNS